jgi:hypothetical protein
MQTPHAPTREKRNGREKKSKGNEKEKNFTLFSRTLTFPPISWPSRYSQELYTIGSSFFTPFSMYPAGRNLPADSTPPQEEEEEEEEKGGVAKVGWTLGEMVVT